MKEFRGSEWRKWDLHIHSKYSCEDRAKLEIKQIFEKAVKGGISVISVTDHSNVDALDEIWETWENGEYIDKERAGIKLEKRIDFLPGVELKASSGKRGIHFICIFPKFIDGNKTDSKFLQNNFLSKIDCTENDVKKCGNGDYKKGLFEIAVDFKKTSQKVRELGGLVIVHAGYDKDHGIESEMAHASAKADEDELFNSLGTEKELLMREFIDVCELPNWNEKNLKQMDFYLTAFNKPTVVFSDAHEDINGEKYTWIKAETTIEGLKQIVFEPKYRVFIGEHKPHNPTIWLRKVNFSFPDKTYLDSDIFCLSGENELVFNSNYNCLIGGRGTGKSTIINLIMEKLKPGVTEFFKDKLLVEHPSGEILSISDNVEIGSEIDEKHIEFISQNQVEDIATKPEVLTEVIYKRIKKQDTDAQLEKLENSLDESINEIDSYLDKIKILKNKMILRKEKKGELGTYENIIRSYDSKEYKELNEKIKKLTQQISESNNAKKKHSLLIENLEQIVKENKIKSEKNAWHNSINEIIGSIEETVIIAKEQDFNDSEKELSEQQILLQGYKYDLSTYLKSKGLTEESLSDISAANTKISTLEEDILLLDYQIKELKEKIDNYKIEKFLEIAKDYKETLQNNISTISKKLESIKSDQIKTISLHYDIDINKIKEEIYKDFRKRFEEEIEELNVKEMYLKELLFSLEPSEVTDDNEELIENIKKSKSLSGAKPWLISFFDEDANFNVYRTIINKHLNNSFKYKLIRVQYDQKRIENTSFGQRCTAALVILLHLGNNPIIIDEPEAHLDSLLISNYLVELIKEKKINRQIIFATHNANFVVNGDAELIHILNMDDDKLTKVKSTTIENKSTRKQLIGLEGGKEAFLKRENKYIIKEIQ